MSKNEKLIDAYLDGEISAEGTDQLQAWLAEDSANCQLFAELTFEERLIRDLLSGEPAVPVTTEKKRSAGKALAAPFGLLEVYGFFAKPTPLSLGVSALVMVVIVTAMAFMAPPFYRAMRSGGENDYDNVYANKTTAEITGVHEVAWIAGQSGTRLNSRLKLGQRMKLDSGLLEVTYDNGTRVILEGPCDFEVTDSGKGRLHQGRLTAYVNAQARGFTIAVPEGEIVDWGTVFAVSVEAGGDAFTEVIAGIVEVHRLNDSATVASMRLRTGEAAELRVDSPSVVESQPRRDFALSLPPEHPTSGGLIGYWQFDDQVPGNSTGTNAADASSSENRATYAGSGPVNWIAGKSGSAFQLGGDNSRFEIADSSKLRVTGSLSVTAWVRPTAPSRYGVIAGIDQAGGSESDMYSLKTNGSDVPHWQVVSGSGGSDVTIDADDTLANFSETAADGWVHLVGVFDSGVGAYLYVNGVLNVSDRTSVPTEIQWVPATPFRIGHNASNRGSNPLHAAVDEIQVYARALSPEEISFLFHNPGAVVSPNSTN